MLLLVSSETLQGATATSAANSWEGNAQGNIILFEPSTSEHLSARTIFDPITALAPASDCRTFAIGYVMQTGNPDTEPVPILTTTSYLNGSILIATLQPSFTILHTLTTPRSPSPIAGLAWHGSSSKQKSEMLAAQSTDGDLRVWSVPKVAHSGDVPCVIRVLNQKEQREPGPCWFAWSKNGRIVQYTEGYVHIQHTP
jgi:WD40 repeat protein